MSAPAHTPGPYDRQGCTVFALDEHGRVNRFSAHVTGGYVNGGQRIAFGDAPERTSEDELLATAALFEAAPELLAVAQMVVEASELAGFSGPLGDAARAAIAKARGDAA